MCVTGGVPEAKPYAYIRDYRYAYGETLHTVNIIRLRAYILGIRIRVFTQAFRDDYSSLLYPRACSVNFLTAARCM